MDDHKITDDEFERLLLASSPYPHGRGRFNRPSLVEPQPPLPKPSARGVRRLPSGGWRPLIAPVTAVAATLAIIAVAGVSLTLPKPTSPGPAATASGSERSPAPDESSLEATPLELPEGELGSGTLITPEGREVGELAVVRRAGEIVFEVSDFELISEMLTPQIAVQAPRDDRCADGPSHEVGGSLVATTSFSVSLPVGAVAHGDPTAVKDFRLRKGFSGGDVCGYESAARAEITWDIGPLRPYLTGLVDSGSRETATGTVTSEDGRAVYTAGDGDTIRGVALRFGISEDDVFYLNEARTPDPEDPDLEPGETLNLDVGDR